MKNYKRILLFFIIVCIMIGLPPYNVQAAHTQQKIKIGYYEDGDYMSRDHNGNYFGFNFEFLEEISKYTGWEYEVIDGKSWDNTLAMLKSGEIDILPAVYYTDERANDFAFSDQPMCNIYMTLNVRADDARYDYEDFNSFTGMKVGVINESEDAKRFQQYCEKNEISVEIIPYAETNDLLKALENADLDGVAITHLGKNSVFRSVAQFSPEPIYFGVSKNKEKILDQLNEVMNGLKLKDPYYESKLFDKYFSVSTAQRPVFSAEEKEFIRTSGTIRAAFDQAWAPLESIDPDTGQFCGVTADLFKSIEETTGLKFEFVPFKSYDDMMKMVKQESVDLVCGIADDYYWGDAFGLNTTKYYLRAPIVRISPEDGQDDCIAMPEGYLITQKIKDEKSDKEIKYYGSLEDCFKALLKGEADSTYANIYIADYLLSDSKYKRFTSATLTNHTDEIGIGVSKSADSRLFTILEKCVQYTASEQMDEMILNNSLEPRKVTWRDFISQHPIAIAAVLSGVLLFIILVLSYSLAVKSKSNKQIQHLLYRDSLTGIWNFTKFRLAAGELLVKSFRGQYAVVYTDISQFKTINDTFGFAEGDELLCSYADILEDEIEKPQECAARVSADQFAMLLRYEGWEQLKERTDRIDRRLNRLMEKTGKAYRLILVFGVYVVQDIERDISLVLDFANYARRSAKVLHKSETVLYDEKMRKDELFKREISDVMGPALKNGEFVPYYQPKVDMNTKIIVGCEALARWQHPQKGLVSPAFFIPYFEQNGFIVEVDIYLYEQVCQAIRGWLDRKIPVYPVSCNFSRLHFKNNNFPQILAEIADRYQIPRHYLELEITESVVMEDLDQVLQQFKRLKELGFLISIDDFGSGYSSFGLLQQMTVDVIKLDRSFLNKGIKEKREQVIIQGVVNVAKELCIDIVCEGVETRDQVEMLTKMGAVVAQGFFYARPMPLEKYEELLIL